MLQLIFILFTAHLSPPEEWNTFNDSLNRYSIQYPADWSQHYIGNAVGFASPFDSDTDTFQENVNVILQDLSAQPLTLKGYTDLTEKQYTDTYGPSSIISLKDTIILGNQAEIGIFTIHYGAFDIKLEQFWFIKKNTAFVITYTAQPMQFNKYRETAEKVMRSFKPLQQKGG